MNTSFFGELLQTISERGRALLTRNRRGEATARSESLVELCEDLLSSRGEASGVARAREILTRYGELTTGSRIAFFEALRERFGPDPARLETASPLGARGLPTQLLPRSMPLLSRAVRNCFAGSIWRRPGPPRWCACASN